MRALKLTWQLATPMVAGAFPVHLDALLVYATAQQNRAIAPNDLASWDESRDMDLPLEREVRGDQWCWKASALVPEKTHGHSLRFWTRPSDPYDYAQRLQGGEFTTKTKFPLKPYSLVFDQQRGLFKNMFKFYPVRDIKTVHAWCVGDEDRILELLSPEAGYVTYLGAKSRMGHGRIISFEMTDAENEEVGFWAKRVLPWQEVGAVSLMAAVHPPYWNPQARQVAWADPTIL